MSYEQKAYSGYNRVVKKYNEPLQHEIFSVQDKIADDPEIGWPLHGSLKGWHSYGFRFEGVSYRIAYKKDDENKIVVFGSVGTRQGFYDKMERKF